MPTAREVRYCQDLTARLDRVRAHLGGIASLSPTDPVGLFRTLATLRELQGNISNDVSFAATLLAKSFLNARLGVDFDAAEKPQGAPGIDIDVRTPSGERVVGEIKTTVPYQANDFGAQQTATFKKDFAKLAAAVASHKFLFVTDSRAFNVLQKPRYLAQIQGVVLVNLGTGEERAA